MVVYEKNGYTVEKDINQHFKDREVCWYIVDTHRNTGLQFKIFRSLEEAVEFIDSL